MEEVPVCKHGFTDGRGGLGILIVVLAALTGCAADGSGPASRGDSTPQQERVQFENPSSTRQVEVVKADTERLAGGLLKVTVTLRNRTRTSLWADIRTSFLDSQGRLLEQTTWEPTLLGSRVDAEYTCVSTGTQASDYRVVIRKPGKSLGLP
jgi:hypothetical protein